MRQIVKIALLLFVTAACGSDGAKKKTSGQASPSAPPVEPAPSTSPAPGVAPAPQVAPSPSNETPSLIMGALGDSITTGLNAKVFFEESSELSWSTGEGVSAEKGSHFARFSSDLGVSEVKAINKAVSGATSDNLADEVDALFDALEGKKARYVTLMIGGNDVCGWPTDHQEALADYRKKVETTLESLIESEPKVRIVLSGVPDLHRLHQLLKGESQCQAIWDLAGGCQSLLSTSATDGDRTAFKARWSDMNATLKQLAASHPTNVRYTGKVSEYAFKLEDISTHDCFHPSAKGQRVISDLTWDEAFARQAISN